MKRALLALLVASALGACGGEDEMSASEYRSEATKICTEAQRATREVKQPTRVTNESIASYFERLVAVNDRTATRFAELDPPEDLQKPHDEALSANREGVQEVRRFVRDLKQGGDARQLLQGVQARLTEQSRRSLAAFKALGVPQCGGSG